jgi:hypothetical protein
MRRRGAGLVLTVCALPAALGAQQRAPFALEQASPTPIPWSW